MQCNESHIVQGHPRTDPAVTSLHEIASWPKTLTAGYYLTILSFHPFLYCDWLGIHLSSYVHDVLEGSSF